MTFSNTNFIHIRNLKIIEVYNAWWTENHCLQVFLLRKLRVLLMIPIDLAILFFM